MEFRSAVKSLEDLCLELILKRKNYGNVLQLYSLSTLVLRPEWKIQCRQYISERFPFYLEKFGEDILIEALDPDDYMIMKASHDARLLAERRFSTKVELLILISSHSRLGQCLRTTNCSSETIRRRILSLGSISCWCDVAPEC
jgi:hypothetical protein